MNCSNERKTILITGASGMIGFAAVKGVLAAGYRVVGVDRRECSEKNEYYRHYASDLADKDALRKIVDENAVDRIIHLAALAHASDGKEYSWEDYRHLNVDCAKNIFDVADKIPVLFISTVDVYGFTSGSVNVQTELDPVSHYAKSKALAESECRKLPYYTIFRFSPVYTNTVKRDIQKRYYLKYPNLAYLIGKGTEYEVLDIRVAVEAMVNWCGREPRNETMNIKNEKKLYTPDCIAEEKKQGRAKYVLYIPKWMANTMFVIARVLTGKNKYTYLLNKAVHPLQTE